MARDALDRGDVGGFSGCASRTRPTRSRRSARGIVVARNDFFRMVVKGLTSKPPFPMVSRLAIFPSLTLGLIAGGPSWVARQSAPEMHPLLTGLLSPGRGSLAPATHYVRSP